MKFRNKPSRIKTLLLGLLAGVAYAFLALLLFKAGSGTVSISYIFVVPLVMGAIPVLFATREQLESYKTIILIPWGIVFLFFLLAFVHGFEGMICLVIILGPFILLGTLGAFIFRLVKLKTDKTGTKLYVSLLVPFLLLLIERNTETPDQFNTVTTSIVIQGADKTRIWENIKNVPAIRDEEIAGHFVHWIGIPKPVSATLDTTAVGGIRRIVWQKGIRFEEKIKTWEEGTGFTYDIDVDAGSIPPETLDEHVVVGGRYFDVTAGSYAITPLDSDRFRVTLTCTYRISTGFNFYSKFWADFLLDDFNRMILEVIKTRSETDNSIP